MATAILALLALHGCRDPAPHRPEPDEPQASSETPTAPDVDPVERFRAVARAAGNTVGDGALVFATYDGCCDPGANCYGNNPATPYGSLALPLAPGERPPPFDLFEAWGPAPPGLHRNHHLRADEAVVLLWRTPPQVKYFGYRSYLNLRFDAETGVPSLVFASLGASLNDLVVAAERGLAPEDIHDTGLVVVTTADRAVEDAVRGWLAEAGIDLRTVHHDRITAEVARFGLDDLADTFGVQWRIAVPDDADAMSAFLGDDRAVVLRITPEVERPAAEPHPWPALPESGSGPEEAGLALAQLQLREAILERHAGLEVVEALPRPANPITLDCIPDCGIGDIHDRHAALSPPFRLGEDDFLVAYGVNHELSGKARYASVALKNLDNQFGFADLNSAEMRGTARFYLPDHPLGDALYAVTFARRCADHPERCVEVGPECPHPGLGSGIQATIRAYLDPATGAAPAAAELVPDAMALFSPTGGHDDRVPTRP